MKSAEEIIEELSECLEKLDLLVPEWSKSKADKNYGDEMKKVVLNVAKSASKEKTASGKEQEAYTSEEYKKYLWKAFEIDVQFYQLDARKTTLEKRVDALRSLLSFEKNQINNTL